MKKILKKSLIFFLTIFALNSFAAELKYAPTMQEGGVFKDVLTQTNITYKVADDENLQLDIAYPEGAAPKSGWPVIVHIHGGGWAGGDRHGGFGFNNGEIKFYTKNGIAIASVSYRFCRQNPVRTIKDCVVDIKDAGRFLVKNSKILKLNPRKMGVYGHSAGGHLSFMAALAPDNLFIGEPSLKDVKVSYTCAVPQSGPTSFVNPKEADAPGMFTMNPNLMNMRLGGTFEETESLRKLISPSEYIKKNSPPMLVIQGGADNIVSPKAALFMEAKAKQVGAPLTLLMVEGGGHSFENADHGKIAEQRREFFLKYLLN